MSIDDIEKIIINRYKGLAPQNTWGEKSYFYNPENLFSRGTYFITIKQKDGENDSASNLNRNGVYRINSGATKNDFKNLFGDRPNRPSKGGIIDGPWNFEEKNVIMPHPVYGWAGWVCVINPNPKIFEEFLKITDNYYAEAVKRFSKKCANY